MYLPGAMANNCLSLFIKSHEVTYYCTINSLMRMLPTTWGHSATLLHFNKPVLNNEQ